MHRIILSLQAVLSPFLLGWIILLSSSEISSAAEVGATLGIAGMVVGMTKEDAIKKFPGQDPGDIEEHLYRSARDVGTGLPLRIHLTFTRKRGRQVLEAVDIRADDPGFFGKWLNFAGKQYGDPVSVSDTSHTYCSADGNYQIEVLKYESIFIRFQNSDSTVSPDYKQCKPTGVRSPSYATVPDVELTSPALAAQSGATHSTFTPASNRGEVYSDLIRCAIVADALRGISNAMKQNVTGAQEQYVQVFTRLVNEANRLKLKENDLLADLGDYKTTSFEKYFKMTRDSDGRPYLTADTAYCKEKGIFD